MPTSTSKTSALILIHGFHGGDGTWGELPSLLKRDPSMDDFDIRVWCYPAGLNKQANRLPALWSQDPAIDTIGKSLRTYLDVELAPTVERIVLVGHSMGGLVIQSFLLEELLAGRAKHLSRIAEVVLIATPSAGLDHARWFTLLTGKLSGQVSNMATNSAFIRELRKHWSTMMDAALASPDKTQVSFRLTTVAGDKDAFVPLSSSLGPFPTAEQHILPGDHRMLTKPETHESRIVSLLRTICKRPQATGRDMILQGQSPQTHALLSKIHSAALLRDTNTLVSIATSLEQSALQAPKAWRALGSAMLDLELFPQSARLLSQYLAFTMPGEQMKPFDNDLPAKHQLGIALASSGDVHGALSILMGTSVSQKNDDPETLGILAGRIKRHWWENRQAKQLGFKALTLYKQGMNAAIKHNLPAHVFYNGINVASLSAALELDESDRNTTLALVQSATDSIATPDYWTVATRAECALLQRRITDALGLYRAAQAHDHSPREWTSTCLQAVENLASLQLPIDTELGRFLKDQLRSQSEDVHLDA